MAVFSGPEIVNNGLVLHLDAANQRSYSGSGTTWNDLANGNNGTLTNGPTYSSDNNGSIVFDGVNDYVDCGSATFLGSSLTGLTVSLWLNFSKIGTQMIAENGTSYNTNTFYIAAENATNLSFLVNNNGTYSRIFATSSYTTNTWYNFVGVWEPNTQTRAFINGVNTSQSHQGASHLVSELQSGNTNLLLGIRPGNSIPFQGSVSNFSIYNRTLTAEEIKQNFEALRGRYNV